MAAATHCALCTHPDPGLTFHHLIPKRVHKRRRFRDLDANTLQSGLWLCRRCHKMVHRSADHLTLATAHRSLDGLLAHPGIGRYAAWARAHPQPHQRPGRAD